MVPAHRPRPLITPQRQPAGRRCAEPRSTGVRMPGPARPPRPAAGIARAGAPAPKSEPRANGLPAPARLGTGRFQAFLALPEGLVPALLADLPSARSCLSGLARATGSSLPGASGGNHQQKQRSAQSCRVGLGSVGSWERGTVPKSPPGSGWQCFGEDLSLSSAQPRAVLKVSHKVAFERVDSESGAPNRPSSLPGL